MRKRTKAMLVILAMLVIGLSVTVFSGARYLGDVDGDNKVTAADARLVLRMSVGLEPMKQIEEHVYSKKVTKEPTCTEKGIMTYKCSKCGVSYTEEIKALGHNYKEISRTKATCTENGSLVKQCTRCKAKITEKIPALGHDFNEKVTKPASCLIMGSKTCTCKRCGYKTDVIIPATGHKWKAATCTTPKTCTICGKISGTALGHNYDSDGKCKRCGEIKSLIEMPDCPLIVSYSASYSGTLYTVCNISDITVETETFTWDEDRVDATLYFTGTKTYDDKGDNYSRSCKIGYKLYDEEDIVVESGNVYTENVAVGEKFRADVKFFELDKNKSYRLVILDIG